MVVAISGPTDETIVSGLTALSPGCSLTLQGLDCNFGTGLAACPSSANCYKATVTTYDAYDSTTNTIPSGAAALSISETAFTVADNQTTNVNFPFSGIPAQIAVVAGNALTQQSGTVYNLIGPGAHPFFAEALDADGNLIAGIGGPSYTISLSDNALQASVTEPASGSPRFTVSPPAALDLTDTATLDVEASYPSGETDGCSYAGAVCSGAVTLDMQSLLAVLGNGVNLYAAEKGTGPISTITSGVNDGLATDLEFDSNGNLYVSVANPYGASGTGAVYEYNLGSTIVGRTITSGLDQPTHMAFDSAGNLFVLNAAGSVTEYAAGGTTPIKTIHVVSDGTWLSLDANDDLWVMAHPGGPFASGPPATSGTVTYYANGSSSGVTLAGLTDPSGMVVNPLNDELFVSDQNVIVSGTPYDCNADCNLYEYAPGSSTGTLASSTAYCGDLAYLYSNATYSYVIADDACSPEFSMYRVQSPSSPFAAWNGGLTNPAGATNAVVVDQQGYVFYASSFYQAVYEFDAYRAQNAPQPVVTITNGVGAPSRLAIIQ
ncbi:MAG TPA: hypothetical protein VMH02_12335 [Verrucomicrobiae bacterium]|nr:hypothetical protein [Verrucomicrobiae bacterium]